MIGCMVRFPDRSLRTAQTGIVVALSAMVAACNPHSGGPLAGRASNEWTRSYAIQPGGEFQVVGAGGTIEVQGTTNPAIDVKAERVVRAATDAMATSMAPRVRISEDVTPDKIVLRTEGLGGITVGVDIEVNFHVTVPVGTKLRLRSANGDITMTNVDGTIVASNSNGAIIGKALRGGIDARAINGNITIDMAAVSKDPIDLRATNGAIQLSLPPTANANVEANCTNGSVDFGNLPLQLTGEQTKRRTRGRLNEGGTPVDLTATNGDIHLLASTPGVAP